MELRPEFLSDQDCQGTTVTSQRLSIIYLLDISHLHKSTLLVFRRAPFFCFTPVVSSTTRQTQACVFQSVPPPWAGVHHPQPPHTDRSKQPNQALEQFYDWFVSIDRSVALIHEAHFQLTSSYCYSTDMHAHCITTSLAPPVVHPNCASYILYHPSGTLHGTSAKPQNVHSYLVQRLESSIIDHRFLLALRPSLLSLRHMFSLESDHVATDKDVTI